MEECVHKTGCSLRSANGSTYYLANKTGKKGESQKSNLTFLLLVLTFFLYKFQTIYLWGN